MEQLPVNQIDPPLIGAGFLARGGARIIDNIVHILLGLVSGFLTGIVAVMYMAITGMSTAELSRRLSVFSIWGAVFSLIGYLVYHIVSEYLCGATLGKLIFKIHVVDKYGAPISFKATFIRSIAYLVDGLFLGAVAYESMSKSRLNQRHGDEWANTAVVQHARLIPSQLPPWWRFFLAFFVAFAVDSFILSVGFFLKVL